MRMHFVTIPIADVGQAEAELNHFLASRRILAVERQLIIDGVRSAWAICISYDEHVAMPASSAPGPAPANDSGKKRSSVDYREVLPEAEFKVFARLRTVRKELAEKEGIPAYAIFTNEQLAAMVRARVRTLADLAKLDGVGKARIDKYGVAFLAVLGADAANGGEVEGAA